MRADNAIYELATVLENIEAHRFPGRLNDVTQGYSGKISRIVQGPAGNALAARRLLQFRRDRLPQRLPRRPLVVAVASVHARCIERSE